MTDGANMGVGAERALGTILGGKEQPKEEEKRTPKQVREDILKYSIEATSYDGTANACARVIYEALEKYPMLQDVPCSTIYLKNKDGSFLGKMVVLTPDLHTVLQNLHKGDPEVLNILQELTGFMWGWAYNTARYALNLPMADNPAIIKF